VAVLVKNADKISPTVKTELVEMAPVAAAAPAKSPAK